MDRKTTTSSDGDDYVSAVVQTPTGWRVAGSVPWSMGQFTRALGSSFSNLINPMPSSADSQGWMSNRADTFLYQVLSTPLAANTTYTLRVDMGDRLDMAFPTGTMIRLGYGDAPGQNLLTPSSLSNATPPNGGWTTWQSTFVTPSAAAGVGQPLRIELVSGGPQAVFDNVRLEMLPVPEPGTWALLVGGLLAWGIGRLRR